MLPALDHRRMTMGQTLRKTLQLVGGDDFAGRFPLCVRLFYRRMGLAALARIGVRGSPLLAKSADWPPYDRSPATSSQALPQSDDSVEKACRAAQLRSERGYLATRYDPTSASPPKCLRPHFGQKYDVKKVLWLACVSSDRKSSPRWVPSPRVNKRSAYRSLILNSQISVIVGLILHFGREMETWTVWLGASNSTLA